MRESKFYLFLGLGVLAFSIIWTLLVFLQIEGDIGEYANTPRTIPFFLGICMGILGLVFFISINKVMCQKIKVSHL